MDEKNVFVVEVPPLGDELKGLTLKPVTSKKDIPISNLDDLEVIEGDDSIVIMFYPLRGHSPEFTVDPYSDY